MTEAVSFYHQNGAAYSAAKPENNQTAASDDIKIFGAEQKDKEKPDYMQAAAALLAIGLFEAATGLNIISKPKNK